jgi:hypothetical protein
MGYISVHQPVHLFNNIIQYLETASTSVETASETVESVLTSVETMKYMKNEIPHYFVFVN